MADVTVVGARGYLGREVLRILQSHPDVDRLHAVSLSGGGGSFAESVPSFRSMPLTLQGDDQAILEGSDVIMLATASGQAKDLARRVAGDHDTLLVDLSRDHRIEALTHNEPLAAASSGTGSTTMQVHGGDDATNPSQPATWIYGLPETPLAPRMGDRRIANPGCYPTAALLSLLPAVTAGIAAPGPLIVDGKSGVSGAGATPRADLHYAETNENVRAYKVIGHDHGDEIQAAVAKTANDAQNARPVRFTPHLVPMNRGLLATSYIPLVEATTQEDAREAYEAAYAQAETVGIVHEPATAYLRGTVRAEIALDLDPNTQILVVRAAIDNLTKGGSGQAVHNMNIALGIEPTTGLPLLGGGP